jgi:preprotein translocase subunit SecA
MNDQRKVVFEQRKELMDAESISETIEDMRHEVIDNLVNLHIPEKAYAVEKEILLRTLDQLWREHIITLEHLRQAVALRGYGQRDPLNEYKSEGFALFEQMVARLRELVTGQLMRVEISQNPQDMFDDDEELPEMHIENFDDDGYELPSEEFDPDNPATWGDIGRNQLCPCGSGKKFKHCHGAYA